MGSNETELLICTNNHVVEDSNVINLYLASGETANARIHDLRHTFAVHRLIQCYRQGQSVQKFLPALSAYMGHKCISHTSVYLTLTPELLSEANSLFENFAQRKEHDNGTDK